MDNFGPASTPTPILACDDAVNSRCPSWRAIRRAAVVCVAPLVLLVGCASGTGTGTGTPPADAPTSTATAAPPVEPTWPTDCDSLGEPGTRSWFFDDGSSWSYSPDKLIPPFPGATTKLDCNWFTGDLTSLTVTFTAGTPQAVTAAVDELLAEGHTCVDDFGGRLCTTSEVSKVDAGFGEPVPVEFYKSVFARDGAWVSMTTSISPEGLPTFMREIVVDLYR